MLRAALRLTAGTATLAAGGWMMRALHGAPEALGAGPAEIRRVAEGSPNFVDGAFTNLDAAAGFDMGLQQQWMVLRELVGGRGVGRPAAPIPLAEPSVEAGEGPAGTWFGHSSVLIEIDGYRVLTDPVWSRRCSPSDSVGPERLHPPPAALDTLPAIDAIVISHDHYDHLDIDAVIALGRTQRAPFVVPLGVGAHLRRWGIPEHRVVELDWGQHHRIADLTVVCTPARHFSGRFVSRNTTLWSSWVLIGERHRVFFGGDSGYTRSFADIGAEHGPFDLTLLPIGAYHRAWPDIHMSPEEAVRAHRDLTDTGLLVPIHWCTFRLAPHPWAEPVERLLAAADPDGVRVAVPRPGGRARPAAGDVVDPWWRL
ncbi:MBL fold metallo-hydrolase [Mycolicibacillus parakoreensis]|uniref:MBL fold metallo-hydrolase n=1 Tax=Mycolicibacillus parakoreensis TaxID=1069221 RepID=A0ABY3U096_9MYCO|nr:MBL fold metallo-hydrolase [Mycolicibacillus parakoreensis]MCV7315279.1 MBL fold metallo-hydrolase [Mycolicibacillus parakoreensis]ULN53392.1 MBL fold metallo-hydrolase [Mycolicibacillus parakoreensis]